MRRSNPLFLALAATAITACGSMTGVRFALLARESEPFDIEVLERDIEARSCKWSMFLPAFPRHSEAVSSAIARVPGADAMIDVTFQEEYTDAGFWFRSCAVVKGAVGRVR